MGRKKYWGHITKDQTIYILNEWFRFIRTWHSKDGSKKGKPRLDDTVGFPKNGLE